MRHKHYDLILAWANGAEIEYFSYYGKCWYGAELPGWHNDFEYRIKPEPKPDVFLYAHAQNYNGKNYGNLSTPMLLENLHLSPNTKANIKLTYDGETNEFKDVEKI